MPRRVSLLLALLLAAPLAAAAESEVSLVLGYRGGDAGFPVEAEARDIACLVPPCVVAEAGTPESEVLGLVLDVAIRPGWMLEARLDRQDGDLRLATSLPPEAGTVAPESFELTILQAGLLRRWGGEPWAPFAAGGVGLARARTSAAVLDSPPGFGEPGRRLGSRDGLAVALGGGARRQLAPRWGLRLEARGLWIDLPRELGGELVQIEIGVGLARRLGG